MAEEQSQLPPKDYKAEAEKFKKGLKVAMILLFILAAAMLMTLGRLSRISGAYNAGYNICVRACNEKIDRCNYEIQQAGGGLPTISPEILVGNNSDAQILITS
jgi:hypothetical protein